ncbi:hypothetical protein [Novosphingobium sp. 9U]|uniref:hypothetical protein n=1 Tax=Novosphingobium sp. 9U TaxID=2653158 RepID=UPI001F45C12E|nr:hypothetical protein [Novosphingobium sp. 9U]
MAEALRRTRNGDLAGATALLLRPDRGKGTNFVPAAADRIIDLEAESVTAKCEPHVSPTSGRFEARRHLGQAGSIDYMLYRPASATPGMPLVIMLHGCTQTP